MKRTIWQPLLLGAVLGGLAGVATITGLSFLSSGAESDNAIGFWMTLLLLSAALGGPLAGIISSSTFITISTFYGPPEVKVILSEPAIFWTNMLVIGTLMMLVGFAYRQIFTHLKMPARLLPWAGMIIAVYLINSPANIILQSFFLQDIDILSQILFGYRAYFPQAIFDIFITSLVLIALPKSYTRPLWYESKRGTKQNN